MACGQQHRTLRRKKVFIAASDARPCGKETAFLRKIGQILQTNANKCIENLSVCDGKGSMLVSKGQGNIAFCHKKLEYAFFLLSCFSLAGCPCGGEITLPPYAETVPFLRDFYRPKGMGGKGVGWMAYGEGQGGGDTRKGRKLIRPLPISLLHLFFPNGLLTRCLGPSWPWPPS